MNKNIVIKSMAALAILTSVTGINAAVVEETQQIANAEKNVTQVKDTNIFPYNGVVSFKDATGFVIGKNTIITNKHVSKDYKVGDRITAHPNGDKGNGGIYKIKSISDYPGDEDISVMNIEEQAVERGQKALILMKMSKHSILRKMLKLMTKLKLLVTHYLLKIVLNSLNLQEL